MWVCYFWEQNTHFADIKQDYVNQLFSGVKWLDSQCRMITAFSASFSVACIPAEAVPVSVLTGFPPFLLPKIPVYPEVLGRAETRKRIFSVFSSVFQPAKAEGFPPPPRHC